MVCIYIYIYSYISCIYNIICKHSIYISRVGGSANHFKHRLSKTPTWKYEVFETADPINFCTYKTGPRRLTSLGPFQYVYISVMSEVIENESFWGWAHMYVYEYMYIYIHYHIWALTSWLTHIMRIRDWVAKDVQSGDPSYKLVYEPR